MTAPGEKKARKLPPEDKRFKPGESGNPRGRPKGSRPATNLTEAALMQPVPTRIDGQLKKVSAVEAALHIALQRLEPHDLKLIAALEECRERRVNAARTSAADQAAEANLGSLFVTEAPTSPSEWEKEYGFLAGGRAANGKSWGDAVNEAHDRGVPVDDVLDGWNINLRGEPK